MYKAHAGNWANLWDASWQQEGVSGFLRPRNADGSWAPQYLVRRGTWPDFYYEGDLWTYSIYAPQDVRKLVQLSGGNEAFVKRLDALFDGLHFDITNEPGFLIPDLYLWAGRPDRTADRLLTYLHKAFKDSRDGIPGNDDSGAMSSWYAFQSMGFYPNAGQDVYLIGTPSYPRVDIDLGGGHIFTIIADNLDGRSVNRYIYALGGNEAATRLSGINVNRVKIIVYSLSGMLAALAGTIEVARLSSAQPTAGTGYELDAIAAVVLGGTSLAGGKGRIFGTLIGALILGFLNNGLNLMGVSSYYQMIVKAVVILLAVLVDNKSSK